MSDEFFNKALKLSGEKEPYAIAMVVNRQIPSSGKPGDKAIIRKNGQIEGWIGGGCTRGIVLKEAQEAILEGSPRLVKIKPNGESTSTKGVKEYPMTCHSGGSVEIYIEPVLPKPHILILGKSHIAMALAKITHAMGYTMDVVAKGAESYAFPQVSTIGEDYYKLDEIVSANTFIVVCTQGENDEDALENAIRTGASYISFVASRRKANAIFNQMRQRGLTFDHLKKIKTPAGLDINAKYPEEVAVSILAEIIKEIRSDQESPSDSQSAEGKKTALEGNENIFINPVCGIPVEKSSAKHVISYKEKDYYFCCDGCKVSFEKEPEKYALA
ncbi:MAG: XdhC family protein [Bacteroidia bacterium]|nr:XdhC family protein [Bacteroidia bacterium]